MPSAPAQCLPQLRHGAQQAEGEGEARRVHRGRVARQARISGAPLAPTLPLRASLAQQAGGEREAQHVRRGRLAWQARISGAPLAPTLPLRASLAQQAGGEREAQRVRRERLARQARISAAPLAPALPLHASLAASKTPHSAAGYRNAWDAADARLGCIFSAPVGRPEDPKTSRTERLPPFKAPP